MGSFCILGRQIHHQVRRPFASQRFRQARDIRTELHLEETRCNLRAESSTGGALSARYDGDPG